MSHTLHRRGSEEALHFDYPLLSRPAVGINNIGSGEKLKQFVRIIMRHNPVNMGLSKKGNLYTTNAEEIIDALEDNRSINAVFDNRKDYEEFLADLKAENWDLSVTTSALFSEVEQICQEVGLTPHSVNFSLGIYGKTELLPPEEILEFTSMCGHHQIAPNLVRKKIEQVKKGIITPEMAANELAKHCPCGVFNTTRAKMLFEKYVGISDN